MINKTFFHIQLSHYKVADKIQILKKTRETPNLTKTDNVQADHCNTAMCISTGYESLINRVIFG